MLCRSLLPVLAIGLLTACAKDLPRQDRPDPSVFECPSDEALCEISLNQQKKKPAQPAPLPPAPANWKPLPGSGTTQFEIDWLYSFNQGLGGISEGVCGIWGCFVDGLGDDHDRIVQICSQEPDDRAKLLCAVREVRAVLRRDEDNVCRHYAVSMWWLLTDLGMTSDLECAPTHSWVETRIGGKRVLVDAYNDILIVVE